MEQSVRKTAEELERIANGRHSAMDYLNETRDEYQRRFQDYLYRAYGVRELPHPDDHGQRNT